MSDATPSTPTKGRTRKSYAPLSATHAGAALIDPDKPLTQQQKIFAKALAEGDNVKGAMIQAGYSIEDQSYGYRMKAMPNVQKAIAKYQAEYQKASELSKREVMDMLKESYDMAKMMAEPATMVSAAREIGKLCGYYEPKKVDINVNMSGSVKFEQLSDAQLFEMIEKAAQEAEKATIELLEDESDAD